MQWLPLAIVLTVWLVLVARKRKARKAERSFNFRLGPRVKMILLGALLNEAYVIAANFRSVSNLPGFFSNPQFQLLLLLRGGVVALIVYEIMWKTRSRLNPSTFPLYVLGVWYIQPKMEVGLYLLIAALQGRISAATKHFYSDPAHWLVPQWSFLYTTLDLLTAFFTVAVAYYLIVGLFPSITLRRTALSGSSYGGTNMSTDETTRLLCASAFTGGRGFRRAVLDHYVEERYAVAPELGVDISLVIQVCKFADKRENRYDWLFLGIGLVALIVNGAVDPTVGLIVLWLGSGAVYLHKNLRERSILLRYFQRGKFDTSLARKELKASLDPDVARGLPSEEQNLIVFRDFTPFVGAGINLGGWSFTVGLDKPREQQLNASPSRKPIPFESGETYAAIDRSLESLGLDRLSIRDVCFVNGADIREDHTVLPDIYGRPAQKLDGPLADKYKNSSDPRIRHYQWISVQDWGNAMITSYFLRCAIRGSSLLVEINRFLLTPLIDSFYSVDKLLTARWRQKLALTIGSVVLGPIWVLRAALLVFAKLTTGVQRVFGTKERNRRREIEDNPFYNYGAQISIRQKFSSNSFNHYFQKVDGDFYTKVLEDKILDAIVTFLDEHNVDTSEIRERRTLILNSGIIVQGGDVRAESLAVGAGATAVKGQPVTGFKKGSSQEAATT